MSREEDYRALVSGLQELDLQGEEHPSDLVLTGESAFPLAMNARGQVLMAASRYGKGRLVVLGHEDYLSRFPGLVENVVAWLMPCAGDGAVGIQSSLASVAVNLSYSRFPTESGGFQNGFGVYICTAYDLEACAADLTAFLKAGGGLLMAGQAWRWAEEHPEENALRSFPGNKVCSVAGVYFSEQRGQTGTYPVPANIPSSWLAVSINTNFKKDLDFLLENVPEFDIQGGAIPSEVMVHGPLAFPIAVTPAGKPFIAGAYYGQGRVILVSHEGYLGRDSLSTFMTNAVRWLDEGRGGVVGVLPNLSAAHAVLSQSGLECQSTDFRRDLSVYVCTSYSDAECEEIQEFVVEGGGLLIGGHAWYWSQTNTGRNVMTEYPGNHILNKMGLCLLGNTLRGGLYKAEETCEDGYHFRNLLRRFVEHVNQGQKLTPRDEGRLKQLGSDCASYLRMQSYDCAAYRSMVGLLSDMVKEVGVPQVCTACPAKSPQDQLMLHVGSEVYKVSPDPDGLLPYIIRDVPDLPTVSDTRVSVSADTGDWEEWISTGLYLCPGMGTYIAVPPEIAGKNWKVQIGCQTDELGGADVLYRAPVACERFPLDSDMVLVRNLWGGLIYLIAPPNSRVDGAEVVVQTAVRAPYYKSGETSVADWVGGVRRAAAPWSELEFENIIITLESEHIRDLDNPDEVAALWDTIMRSIAELAAKPAKFPRKERFVADVQIAYGFMHAGYPIMMQTGSAPVLVNPAAARDGGMWGAIHELGHNQQRGVWEFPPHTTECTCNLWSVYVHEEVLGRSRADAHPAMTLENRSSRAASYAAGGRDLQSWSMWTALETYMQLQEKFGWDAFKKVFWEYQHMSDVPHDNPGKMNLYAHTFSRAVGTNLCGFFRAWGWPIQTDTEEKLQHLPHWSDHPMAPFH